ncbi:hypothetical protein V6N11_079726 [Hibiscus sabdariffa]|uniref:Uncharacterized protein n=1 Tax=Hibiscus sabdariffa TaxID=183260 RepID=A0ABR2RWY5_9ROSI
MHGRFPTKDELQKLGGLATLVSSVKCLSFSSYQVQPSLSFLCGMGGIGKSILTVRILFSKVRPGSDYGTGGKDFYLFRAKEDTNLSATPLRKAFAVHSDV